MNEHLEILCKMSGDSARDAIADAAKLLAERIAYDRPMTWDVRVNWIGACYLAFGQAVALAHGHRELSNAVDSLGYEMVKWRDGEMRAIGEQVERPEPEPELAPAPRLTKEIWVSCESPYSLAQSAVELGVDIRPIALACAERAVRHYAMVALLRAGKKQHADAVYALAPIVSEQTARAAVELLAKIEKEIDDHLNTYDEEETKRNRNALSCVRSASGAADCAHSDPVEATGCAVSAARVMGDRDYEVELQLRALHALWPEVDAALGSV